MKLVVLLDSRPLGLLCQTRRPAVVSPFGLGAASRAALVRLGSPELLQVGAASRAALVRLGSPELLVGAASRAALVRLGSPELLQTESRAALLRLGSPDLLQTETLPIAG